MTYTREQILSMPVGCELDALVAEVALELKVRMLNEVTDNAFKLQYDRKVIDVGEGRYGCLARYSTDISAALEVVEKMRKNKIYLDIRVWPEEYQVLPHQDEHNKLIEHCIVKSPSLPEAICKAALLASLGESGGTGE